MPERNSAGSSVLTSSPLGSGLEVVRMVIQGLNPMPYVTHLGFPVRLVEGFLGNHDQTATDVQPAESTEALHWHEVGWIFRQGQCLAIEGKGPEVRARVMAA